jgi:O-antigen ligase
MDSQAANRAVDEKLIPDSRDQSLFAQVHLAEPRRAIRVAGAVRLLARVCFAGVIVLAPLRYLSVLVPHTIPPIYADYTNLLIFPSDLLMVGALVLWTASLTLQPRRITLRPLGLTLPVAGLTLVAMLSSIFSADAIVSVYQSVRLLLLAGMYLFVLNEILTLAWVIAPSALMVLSQSIVGILQVLRQHSLGLTGLNELALDPAWNGVSVVWSVTARSLRAYGLTDHPNILGGLLALGLIFLAIWYLETNDQWRPFVASLFGLGCIGLLVTFSRSAYLGLMFGLLLVAGWLWFSHNKQGFNRLLVLGAGSLVLLAPFLWQNAANLGTRFNYENSFFTPTAENQAINERFLLIGEGSAIFSTHPLTGVGVGAFPIALHLADPNYQLDFQPPHLVLVDVAAETGIFGALFYLLIELFPWAYMYLRHKQIQFTPALVGVSAAMLAISTISLFDYYPWMLNPGRLWQWLVWGLWAMLISQSSRKDAIHA